MTEPTSTPPAGATGLSSAEAASRLQQYGPNALQEEHVSALRRLLGYFWGPIPWMIEIAALLSAVLRHWADFWIIVALLIFNAAVGFWQEFTAGNAVEALKKQLALKARVLRDGRWQEIDARQLVPGDVIRIRLGDVIPADVKITEGDYLSVDQSALTGESMPVTRRAGDEAFSGTVVKQGEVVAQVTATGQHTRFGKTASLVEQARTVSHFQKAVLTIGDYLIYVSLALVVVLVLFQLHRNAPWLELVQFALILTVASIPVAMPAVLSMTMALGAMALSRRKAIVTRLESIEEMASMDVLCSDKTGTLTQNRLTLGEIELFHADDPQEVLLAAALASREEDRDAIDEAVLQGLQDRDRLAALQQTAFTPFDPVHKRTEATVRDGDGHLFQVTKGAPQVIMGMAALTEEEQARAQQVVDRFASQGYRALGVARRDGSGGEWRFLGILSLFDPPREDSAATIASAREHGVRVKMVTGDNLAIARQIAGKLGLGQNILKADSLPTGSDGGAAGSGAAERVEQADGFAEVFPEHKFAIVRMLQERNHIAGMTGDGVNDAPALKQADVGIAVSGATDAARAAADLVLTAPGLSVIIAAIEEARRIFERMNAYAIYRISETVRIMFFVVLAMIFFNFYPITAVMIILLAFFNDIPIMTIAYDHTSLEKDPVRWDMRQVITVATAMGVTGVVGSFGMLLIAMDWLHLNIGQIQTYVFLKMAVAGHLVLFVARSRGHFWRRPWPAPIMVWSAIVTKIAATLLAAYGFGLITPISWPEIALIWGYSFASAYVTDLVKVAVYRHLGHRSPRHQTFIRTLKARLVHGGR
ncbi:MAG TPA: plasma-membrane proton-efflux P-type ATPase [Sedimenticola thiotaurini]|uniref:Plasma-membrane proton-efflux P-type ATPase n=1 Tax=Sedimenticola thiotaurini TaxID=1543721 RepID=A0A831W2I5_9GAMM|nr:plasma-membrane proton-efflux P-type ATPase [Sedimenticola thiotaurini]